MTSPLCIRKTCVHVALFSLTLATPILSARQVIYPTDSGIVDITAAPYHAKGDGMTDNTKAIQQALDDHPSSSAIIYVPHGTFLISDTLRWGKGRNESEREKRTKLQGQSRSGSVIKLVDHAAGYQDPKQRRAMVFTGTPPAQRFGNAVSDLTLDTGTGNAGAVGLQFNTSNQGAVINVHIRSGDGAGVAGLDMFYTNEIGPLLVRNLRVDGFDVGILTGRDINSQTFEHIELNQQNVAGIKNQGQVLSIRRLTSNNKVPAIINSHASSLLVLVDADLRGGAPSNAAIENACGSQMLLRSIRTDGYKHALKHGAEPAVGGSHIEHWVSTPTLSLFPSADRTLGLEVLETPEIAWGEPDKDWISPLAFGAVQTPQNQRTGEDITEALQKAMNAGRPTVYFPRGRWTFNGTVNVPSHVRRIIGCMAQIRGEGNFLIQENGEPLVIEWLENNYSKIGYQHRSPRTLILKHGVSGGMYQPSPGAGDLFLEDFVIGHLEFLQGQKVFARQLNSENFGTKITNNGASFWMLGYKTERPGILILTNNGGKTELLGGLNYSTAGPKEEPIFVIEEGATATFSMAETNNNRHPYYLQVRETRDGETRTLYRDEVPSRGGGSVIPLFSAAVPAVGEFITTPIVRKEPSLDVGQMTRKAHPKADESLPAVIGTPVEFPKDFKLNVLEDFSWLEPGQNPSGQHGWETTPTQGRLPASGVQNVQGNEAVGVFGITGIRGKDLVIAEKSLPKLAPSGKQVVYSFWTRSVPTEGGTAWETVAGPRVKRTEEEPLTYGPDTSPKGLGPRFGLSRAGKDQPVRFRLIRAGRHLVAANRQHILESKVSGRVGEWYELRLVVAINQQDITKSTGSLYFRNVTVGDTTFQATDLLDVDLGFTEQLQPKNFNTWTISGKHSGEHDNIGVGILDGVVKHGAN